MTITIGSSTKQAEVRFVGPLQGMQGFFLGVQYDDKVGKNDGQHNGRRYFRCPPNHGGFVRATKVTRRRDWRAGGSPIARGACLRFFARSRTTIRVLSCKSSLAYSLACSLAYSLAYSLACSDTNPADMELTWRSAAPKDERGHRGRRDGCLRAAFTVAPVFHVAACNSPADASVQGSGWVRRCRRRWCACALRTLACHIAPC